MMPLPDCRPERGERRRDLLPSGLEALAQRGARAVGCGVHAAFVDGMPCDRLGAEAGFYTVDTLQRAPAAATVIQPLAGVLGWVAAPVRDCAEEAYHEDGQEAGAGAGLGSEAASTSRDGLPRRF